MIKVIRIGKIVLKKRKYGEVEYFTAQIVTVVKFLLRMYKLVEYQ